MHSETGRLFSSLLLLLLLLLELDVSSGMPECLRGNLARIFDLRSTITCTKRQPRALLQAVCCNNAVGSATGFRFDDDVFVEGAAQPARAIGGGGWCLED